MVLPQAVPFALSAAQRPPLQKSEVEHVVPPQHGWPAPPQRQVLLESQTSWDPHTLLLQHGWSLPPHVAQLPAEHTVPVAVQELLAQHSWLNPPQLPHVPLDVQTTPEPLQVPPTPPQHAWPLAPQAHAPEAQVRFALHAVAPEQQD